MNNKILIGLLLIIPLIAFVSAEEVNDLPTYKMGKAANLSIQCLNNNTYCSAAAVCNLTLSTPDGVLVVSNARMTNQISFHNYTLTPSHTLVQGVHSANVVCQDGAVATEPIQWNILLTPSGLNGVFGLTIIMFVIAYGLALFGFFGKNEWVCILGGFTMMSLGVYSMLNGIDVYRTSMTDAISIVTIFTGAFFALFAGVSVIQEAMDT